MSMKASQKVQKSKKACMRISGGWKTDGPFKFAERDS